jgi:hypothetical protein
VQDFEKLGAFYLGKRYDLGRRALQDELVLYDAKDLTTHAVCVGMTGSGKTGLCLALLEEAAIDGVPAILIDPKGDLANLALTFPDLAPENFRPWIDPSDATRAGMTPDQFAAETARRWRRGLADWGQDAARIERFRAAVDIPIYTPGSNAGLPLTVLRSFDAPAPQLIEDADAFRQRVNSSASGLLALLGIDADPVRSREHILISILLDRAWRSGRNVDIAALIREIQRPPLEQVGVLDLETFYPAKERVALAMSLNNLLASPAFASWLEGAPLNINELLYTPAGKPRLSILSIAHLSDAERMFFVTILLNEIVTWMRTQPGTSSLRAILYMDEVFGYFPPTANPPSKLPMLTLLKQARAFGLGVVLATQNPVDLDYKGLANAGTWLLGRLQTERDKARVLEGLEGAATQSGSGFDRGQMANNLAALGNRVFLMHNVHEDAPVVFKTRWVLSYLRGPLTQSQLKTLMAPRKAAAEEPLAEAPTEGPLPASLSVADGAAAVAERPVLPADVDERFVTCSRRPTSEQQLVYRPALYARVKLHFARATYKIDHWEDRGLLALLPEEIVGSPWDNATPLSHHALPTDPLPEPNARFGPVPDELLNPQSLSTWQKQLKTFCYRTQRLDVWKCPPLKAYSHPGESQRDFRVRLTQLARQKRDLAIEKLRHRYATKFNTLEKRIATAVERLQREKTESQKASIDSAISLGSSLLGALMGRKLASRTNVRRASSSAKRISAAAKQHSDVAAAKKKLSAARRELAEVETELAGAIDTLNASLHPSGLPIEPVPLKPRKADIQVAELSVAWTPWQVDPSGHAERAFPLEVTVHGP